MALGLEYSGEGFDERQGHTYPIANLGDVKLHFNHYESFEAAKEMWERRKKRINWENLFVMFFDDNPELITKFCELPFRHKVCFTSLEYDDPCIFKVNISEVPLWNVVNGMASGRYAFYNIFDMLTW